MKTVYLLTADCEGDVLSWVEVCPDRSLWVKAPRCEVMWVLRWRRLQLIPATSSQLLECNELVNRTQVCVIIIRAVLTCPISFSSFFSFL